MICSLSELRNKDVINLLNGEKLGYIDDAEFDPETGNIIAFVIYGRERLWGLLGKDKDIVLSCKDIELIGRDAVLVKFHEDLCESSGRRKKAVFEKIIIKKEKNT
ncbi:PRC-barrel domain-containing protein [Porcipelethomonas sp.]|uniref:PRC-barrel domain-containing protein n=1 Tax=Porcipelethomonas sp. TaxID=2981675 RepID=UPI003EF82D36